jgi:hypothetical protein
MAKTSRTNPGYGFTPEGKIDIQEFYVGKSGVGKSTLALQRILDFQRKTKCIVIAHDVGRNIPVALYNGRKTEVVRHSNFDAATRSLMRSGNGIQAFDTLEWDRVVQYAMLVGERAYSEGRHCILYIDEIANMQGATTHNKLDDTMLTLITQRRHENVNCGIYICTQWPQICHHAIYGNATKVFCFRLTNEQSILGTKRMGIPGAIREELPQLPNHEYREVEL